MQLPLWVTSYMLGCARWFPDTSCYLVISYYYQRDVRDISHNDTKTRKGTKTGHLPKEAQTHSIIKKQILQYFPSPPRSSKPGQFSVIPTEARASVAQVGQRVGSPYMVPMKSRTKLGKRFSTMLARTAPISRN